MNLSLPIEWVIRHAINTFEGYIETDDVRVVDEICAKDPQESFLHCEPQMDYRGRIILWQIWRKADWIEGEPKRQKAKAESAQRIANWERRKRNIIKLKLGIKSITGLDDLDAENMAARIVDHKPQGARAFSVVLEEETK